VTAARLRRPCRGLAAALAAALILAGAPARGEDVRAGSPPRESASPVATGPLLVDYPMECVQPRGCRIECFQDGRSIVSRGDIGLQDEVRLVIAASAATRWIEIRPFNQNNVQTLLLTDETFCDLGSLVIAPNRRP